MAEMFIDGGYMMWPILICGALVVGLAVIAATRLLREPRGSLAEARSGIDAILFWGAFAFVLGVLGTVVGVMQIAQVLERAGEVPGHLLWGGVKVVLITTVFGLLVLTLALLTWFALWARYRKVVRPRPA